MHFFIDILVESSIVKPFLGNLLNYLEKKYRFLNLRLFFEGEYVVSLANTTSASRDRFALATFQAV